MAAIPSALLAALPAARLLARLLADDTMHTLPWYFGVAVFGFWAAMAAGFTLLFRQRLRARAERRRDSRGRGSRPDRAPVRDDRSLESGKDLERW